MRRAMSSAVLKAIERRAKTVLYKNVFAKLFRNAPASIPIDKTRVKRILLIRRDMIGDMILTTSGIEFLSRVAPHAKLDVFCSPKGFLVLERNPRVDRLFVADLKSLVQTLRVAFRLRKESYDLILALTFGRATQDGLLANVISTRAIKACMLLPKSADLYPVLFNAPVDIGARRDEPPKPLFENLHRFLATLFGEKSDFALLKQEIFISEPEKEIAETFWRERIRSRFIVFNVSARLREKEWGLGNARRFLERFAPAFPELRVVVTCDEKDRADVEAALKGLPFENVALSPRMHLRSLAHLVSKSELLVSPDTALAHIAATFNVPSIILCVERHSGTEFAPMGKHETIWAETGRTIESIPPELVFSKVQTALTSK